MSLILMELLTSLVDCKNNLLVAHFIFFETAVLTVIIFCLFTDTDISCIHVAGY